MFVVCGVMQVALDDRQMMHYVVNISNKWTTVSPEYVGSLILKQLRETGERNLSVPLNRAVMAVPAEFDQQQRNYTKSAAQLAGGSPLKSLTLVINVLLAGGSPVKSLTLVISTHILVLFSLTFQCILLTFANLLLEWPGSMWAWG